MANPTGEPPKALAAALRRLLAPLVRLLISHGVTLPYLTNVLKRVFVDVAERDFPLTGKSPSDSRVSLLTGVHRKDVRRLRNEHDVKQSTPQAISLGAQVIAAWVSDKRYTDKDGKARILPMRADARRKRCFEELVATVSKQDLRPRVVLDELLRLGIVATHEDGSIELLVDAFVPASGFDEKAHYFGQNVGDHIAAAAHNLSNDDEPFFERAVTYHQLSEADVEELRAIAERHAMQALKLINQRARQMKRRNADKEGTWQRINFGSYFFAEPHRDDDGSDDDST